MRRSILLISIPLFVAPIMGILGSSHAQAQTVGAVSATEMLAKSLASNSHCNYLSVAEQDELSSYVARAEVSLVEQVNKSAAQEAVARGRTLGMNAACTPENKQEVTEVLSAARTAIAALPTAASKTEVNVEKTPTLPMLAAQGPLKIKKPQKIAILTKAKVTASLQKPTPVKLASYESIASKYYLARRCQNMSSGAISRFYKTVVATHKKSVATFGVAAVSAVMRKAESRANGQRCT